MMTVAGKQEVDLNAEKKRSQLLEVWRRLKKSKVAIVGLVILIFLIFIAEAFFFLPEFPESVLRAARTAGSVPPQCPGIRPG